MRVTSIDFYDHGKRVPAGTPVSELSNRCRDSVESAGWTCEAEKPAKPAKPAKEPKQPKTETVEGGTKDEPQAAQPAADAKPAKATNASKAKTRGSK